jgi:starch synthase
MQDPHVIASFDDLFGGPARLVRAQVDDSPTFVLVDAPHLYGRPGNPYLGPDGKDYADNHFRFAALCRAAARLVVAEPDGWTVDVVHGHDWQAGLVSAYLRLGDAGLPPSIFTVHNIAFAGLFPADQLSSLGLPDSFFHPERLEFYGQISFLKAGLVFSDRVTTVSPTYAQEIQSTELGMGFQGVLLARANDFCGILNGIDETVWNPETDPLIAQPFHPRSLAGKRVNRVAAQSAMKLDPDAAALLFTVVSRLTHQKGLDLLAAALPGLVARGGQLALLGSGSAELEALFERAAADHPGRVGVRIGYDEPLSHLLIAGGDAIVLAVALRTLRSHPALWIALWHDPDRGANRGPQRFPSSMRMLPGWRLALRPASCSDRTAAKSSSGHSRAPSTSLPTAQSGSASSVQQ